MLEVLDQLSMPGNPEKQNEDALGTSDNAVVVMDGATGLGDNLMPGKSDAAWLSAFGARRLMSYARDGATPQEAVTAALFDAQTSFEALRRRTPSGTWETPFSSMMLIAQDAQGIEALWFGDCAALVKRPDGKVELVGEAFEKRQKEAQRAARLAEKHNISPATQFRRPEILDSLKRARNHVNTVEGSWAFGPDVRAADHLSSAKIDAPKGSLILLCSDGFLALASDYNAYDEAGLMAAIVEKGLAALGEEVRAIEDTDPEGRKFPRFKKSDDCTALLVRVA